ncbi:MAG: flagellar biosynthesis protein FlhF, partial [Deltaproteobacteria bacterium]|nr:flagellar biosynthesis protein FlhF [Nannocystaceae bacterium]
LRGLLGPAVGLGTPRSRVVAFVGPTGVGKTTTVAKLAASASLLSGQKVALVSLDDGRIGGTAALRAYAKLLELPITVAPPHGLSQALADHRDAELVLVDTAGLSPAQPEGFAELGRKLGRAGEPVLTHLCVAAATRIEELERISHLYRAADPKALLVTKVDEAIAIGSVLALRMRSELPFSYAATGPQVPDDLTSAHPDFLLDLLLGGMRT